MICGPYLSACRHTASKISRDRGKEMSRKGEGFTLVECLIAIFILSFVLLGLAAFMGSLMRANLQSKQIQTASTVMEGKMEELKNIPPNLLTNGSDTFHEGSTTYTRTWTVAPIGGNLNSINVKVEIGSTGKTVPADTVRN